MLNILHILSFDHLTFFFSGLDIMLYILGWNPLMLATIKLILPFTERELMLANKYKINLDLLAKRKAGWEDSDVKSLFLITYASTPTVFLFVLVTFSNISHFPMYCGHLENPLIAQRTNRICSSADSSQKKSSGLAGDWPFQN